MNTKYITTPIYYANGSPHIGHFLTTTVTDALARFYRKSLGDDNVFFTTGLDEHGTTVEQSAIKEGFAPADFQQYVNKRASEWQKAFDSTAISYDYFVRTTNTTHKKFAQDFIQKLVDAGDVYKATYTGKYCNGCEKFLTLSDQTANGFCPLHREDQVVELQEENYFFRLAKYAPKIRALLDSNTIKISPEAKKTEMLARLTDVADLSISRPIEKVGWGVLFPGDDKQTVYVWVEALINYLSSLEIAGKPELWESAVHLVGKDINWFHNVIWPAFLLSAGYAPHKESFVHSFLTVSGQKISKSLGNTITPDELVQNYGIDGARYLTLKNLPYKDDADITWDVLDETYNADLANGLGNTVARLTKLAQTSGFDFDLPHPTAELWHAAWVHPIAEYRLDLVLYNIWAQLAELDKHINEHTPWALTDPITLREILEYELGELLKIAVSVEPFLPNTSQKIQAVLTERRIVATSGLFPRIQR